MNICIITSRYPYKDNMEFVFVKKLVDEWAKNGHHCVVITSFSLTSFLRKRIDYKPKHYCYKVENGSTVNVYNPRILTSKISIKGISLDDWINTKAIEKILQSLNIRFDIMYCHFISSAIKVFRYCQKNNIPLFLATGESKINDLKKPYPEFTWEDFRSYTTGVVAVSSKNKSEATKKGYIELDKCTVFPNGTDLSRFRSLNRTECRQQLGLPEDYFIISCVGYICERKGQNRLLEAVKKLNVSKIKIVYLGKEAKIDSFTLEGDEILFKGPIDNEVLPTYLCASDVFCLPTRAEGCCNAIIEALACGLPIISSNLPFNWDVLDVTNSILVDPDNIDEIASAILLLFNDSAKRNSLTIGALNKAKNLSIQKRAESILSFIENSIHFNNTNI